MAIVEARALIRATQAEAFGLAMDSARRSEWDPFSAARDAYVFDADGRYANVTTWTGMKMRIEHVAWFPPERAAIRMVSGPPVLEVFAGSWAFRQQGELVDARFRYQIKAKPLWRWAEPLMLLYFRWETRRRLAALKRHLEAQS